MAKRQKQWARLTLVTLKFLLGGRCKKCRSLDLSILQFDCIVSQGDGHHKMDTSHRASFYTRQYKENNLQLLCEPCHIKKNAKEMKAKERKEKKENRPF